MPMDSHNWNVLFTGENTAGLNAACQVLHDAGYRFSALYCDSPMLMDELERNQIQLLIVSARGSGDHPESFFKGNSFSAIPWIWVYEAPEKKTLQKAYEAGCYDAVLVDDMERLVFVFQRLMGEVSGRKEEKAAMTRLLADKDLLEKTVQNMGDGVITVDSAGIISMMNKSAEEITGWTFEEAARTPFRYVFRIIEKTTGESLDHLIADAIANRKKRGLKRDTVLVARDGNEKYISASISPTSVFGDSMGAVIVFRDITRIREAEIELTSYKLLSDNANDIILFCGSDGRIKKANAAALRSYGYSGDEILCMTIQDLIEPDESRFELSRPGKKHPNEIYYEAMARRKDGSTFSVEVSLEEALIGKDKVILSIQRDITERKQVLLKLEEAGKRAEAANKAKGEFLANISHEIRTPLNGMLGMIELTLLTSMTPQQSENLRIAKNCAGTLLGLINDVLDFSKIEAGKLMVDNIGFQLSDMVYGIIEPHKAKAGSKGIYLGYHLDPLIPSTVFGDQVKLQQVLNNLMGNAVKFTDRGGVDLNVTLKESLADSDIVEFRVTDTGVGISPEAKERIFESFRQEDNSVTRKYGGSGLGLAISKRLVEMMGGTIWVISKKGEGSQFGFTVTFSRTGALDHKDLQAGSVVRSDCPRRILVAEDDPVNAIVITRMLMEGGHEAEIAVNGLEALKAHGDKSFDAILMDIHMPVMDGVEATKKIREKEKSTGMHIPIVAITANVFQGDQERYLAAGMDGYIAKPVNIREMLDSVEKIIGSAQPGNPANLENRPQPGPVRSQDQTLKILHAHAESIRAALSTNHFSQAENYAHEMKNLSNDLNALAIKSAVFKLEMAARREDAEACAANLNLVEQELENYKKN